MKEYVNQYLWKATAGVLTVFVAAMLSCKVEGEPYEQDAPDDEPKMTLTTAIMNDVDIYLAGKGKAVIDWSVDGLAPEEVALLPLDDILGNLEDYRHTHTYTNATPRTIAIEGNDVAFLMCPYNNLTNIDVSQNAALTTLMVDVNSLTSVNLSANTALTAFSCSNNSLTELDVRANTALLELYVEENSLTRLDVGANTALTNLLCDDNDLTRLDVSANTALIALSISDNPVTALDVTNNTRLEELYVDECAFTVDEIGRAHV
jgi:hypothetical protein